MRTKDFFILPGPTITSWAKGARDGEVLVYASGISFIDNETMYEVKAAKAARDLAESGRFALFQRRRPDIGFDYLLIRLIERHRAVLQSVANGEESGT